MGEWRENYSMSRLNTWRVGGPAEAVFTPADADDLEKFLRAHRGRRLLFIGHGSNLLVRDGGVSGVVVRTAPGLSAMHRLEDGRVYAEAGVGCPKLARFCAKHGLAGGEFLAGIPGTVGGALAMNAGCHGGEIWDLVHSATVFDDGQKQTRPAGDFAVGYRKVAAKNRRLVFFAAATLHFAIGDKTVAEEKMKTLLRRRGDSQPIGAASAGSVFRNPPGHTAARLIESCGLKGLRRGDAEISRKHANFIVNRGGALAADIEFLMCEVRKKVRAQTGVQLTPEVCIVGEKQ